MRPTVLTDLGGTRSVCSTIAAANTLSKMGLEDVVLLLSEEALSSFSELVREEVHCARADSHKVNKEALCVDFTEPGFGLSDLLISDVESYSFHLDSSPSDVLNILQEKMDFLLHLLDIDESYVSSKSHLQTNQAMMTRSAELASRLNARGIPTIEICAKGELHGSFLPGSLIILEESGRVTPSEEVRFLFDVYKSDKLDDLFVSRGVLSMDIQLIYYKYDDHLHKIVKKSFPVSETEQLIEHVLGNFVGSSHQKSFAVSQLLELIHKMDHLDVEMTLQFLERSLKFCLDDINEHRFPLVGSYWSLVQPYLQGLQQGESAGLKEKIQKGLLGLDMIQRIHERRRKVISMH